MKKPPTFQKKKNGTAIPKKETSATIKASLNGKSKNGKALKTAKKQTPAKASKPAAAQAPKKKAAVPQPAPVKKNGEAPSAAEAENKNSRKQSGLSARKAEKAAEARDRFINLKRKMHREIFERCVEKHFFSNITEWDEVAIPEKDSGE